MWRLALCALVVGASLPAAAVSIEPDPLQVGATFHGGTVVVRGTTAADTTVFVVITGSTVKENFNRKGRIGPLWANVGKVTVAAVPRLFLVAGSVPADRVLDRPLIDRNLLDLEALGRTAKITGPGHDPAELQREYVRLKRSEHVFAVHPDAVKLTPGPGGVAYEARLPWPDTAAAGDYRVEVVHVRDRAVVRREEGQVHVRLVGLPRFIAHMAFDRAPLYGLLSVLVSLFVGFVMGLVFKRKGGAAH